MDKIGSSFSKSGLPLFESQDLLLFESQDLLLFQSQDLLLFQSLELLLFQSLDPTTVLDGSGQEVDLGRASGLETCLRLGACPGSARRPAAKWRSVRLPIAMGKPVTVIVKF